jgi:DnaJ-domain-containing protein 1
MIFLFTLFLIFAVIIYLNILDEKIRKASIESRINNYSKTNNADNSNVKFWYKKTFTREFHKYIYDLSPFRTRLWIVSIIDRKSFNRYLYIDQFNVVVVLASLHLVMTDDKFTTKELSHINQFYGQFLDSKKKSDLIWLLRLYKKNGINLVPELRKGNLVLETVVEGINIYFSKQHKLTLIYYLFELAESDEAISNQELDFIFRLSKSIGLSKPELNSITSLYFSSYIPYPEAGFKRTEKSRHQSKGKKGNSQKKYQNHSKLENALSIFNLKQNATNKEIKSAYRQAVKTYHPDLVAHLGDEHVLKATAFFKRITVAYDYLQQVKGIK